MYKGIRKSKCVCVCVCVYCLIIDIDLILSKSMLLMKLIHIINTVGLIK